MRSRVVMVFSCGWGRFISRRLPWKRRATRASVRAAPHFRISGSEIAHGGVHDTGPLGAGARDNRLRIFAVLRQNCGVHEEIELAIDDIGIADITIEFLSDEDAKGAEAAELRQVA